MPSDAPVLLLQLLTVGSLAALWSYVGLRRPPKPFEPNLKVILASGIAYTAGDALTHDPAGLLQENLGLGLLYSGNAVACGGWFVLACGIALRGRAQRRLFRRLAVAIVGGLVLVAWSNPIHGLLLEPVLGARNLYGPLWWVHAAACSLMMVSAVLLLTVRAPSLPGPERRSARLMAVVGAGVMASSLTYALLPIELPLDPVVPVTLVSSVALVIGIYRLRIFDVLPNTLPEIVERTLDAIVLGDDAGRVLYANQSAHRLLGAKLEVGTPLFDLLSQQLEDDTGDLDEEVIREALLRSQGSDLTMNVRTREEPRRTLSLRLHELTWGRQQVAMAVELEDITQEQLQRRRLRLSEERMRRLIYTAPIGIFSCDLDGVVEIVNPRMVEIVGARDELEIQGRNVLRDPLDRGGELSSTLKRCLERGASTFMEFEEVTAWGRKVVLRLQTEPLRDADEEQVGALTMVEDVTEAQRRDREQRELEHRMFKAQRLQSLGMVAGAIAHDFNNMLTVIRGHVELAQRKDLGDDVRPHLDKILTSTGHAEELSDQIMAYAGRAPSMMRPLDLSEVASEIETLLEAVVGKRVKLTIELEPDLPRVLGDSGQLRQILVNLLLNAAHAQEGRPGQVTLRTFSSSEPPKPSSLVPGFEVADGPYVTIEVEDQGVGMSESTKERIFEPFFTTRDDGRGLGLAATLGIVRSHGGALGLRTVLDGGTTFRIHLPQLDPDVADSD